MRSLWLVALAACGRIGFGPSDGDGDGGSGGPDGDVVVRTACTLQGTGAIAAEAVTADPAGNLYLLGEFDGTLQVGATSLTMTGMSVVATGTLACSGLPGTGPAALQPARPRNSTAETIRACAPTAVY